MHTLNSANFWGKLQKVSALLVIGGLLLAACAEPTPAPTAAPPNETPDPRSGVVADFTGPVQGRRVNAEALSDVNIGFRILETGEVRTGESARARLDLSDGAIVRLASNTQYVLESAQPDEFGFVFAEMQLLLGKIWISLTGGEAQIETPLGVATVRGSFGIVAYDPAVSVMRFDCFEGTCTVTSPVFTGQINPMERLVLNQNNFLRQPIPPEEVQQFIADNPESARLVATLTALPPLAPSATPTPQATATETATATSPATATATLALPTDTATPTFTPQAPTATFTPAFTILGQHTVRRGETLFCIGRGYGVLPSAIAEANSFTTSTALSTNQVLRIPAVQWVNISAGPSCQTQFQSPYPGLPPGVPPTTPAPGGNVPPTTPAPILGGPKVVLADYAMWYDQNDFSPNYMWDVPQAGAYNSDDAATIQRQVAEAQQACLNGFAPHWYGPSDARTTNNFNQLLSASSGTNLQHAAVLLVNTLPGVSEQTIIDAINYLGKNWGQHPNYLRVGGRPVIFFVDMQRPWDSSSPSSIALQGWQRVRAAADPNHTQLWMAEGLYTTYNPTFDGLYVYRIAHATVPNAYTKQPGFARNLRALESQLLASGGLPIGKLYWGDTIAAGFDDTRSVNLPPGTDLRVSAQPFAIDRRSGGYYSDTFSVTSQTNGDLMLVKSYNEWIEGTEIEPGNSYSNTYLNLTCQFANTFRSR